MWSADKYSWSLFPHFPSKTALFISHFSVSSFTCVTILGYYFTNCCRQLWKDWQRWIWSLWIWSQGYRGACGMWSSHCPGHTPASHKSFLCLHTAANCSAQAEVCCFSGQVAVNSHMGACSGRPGVIVCPVSYPYQLQPACGRGQHPNSCITINSFPSSYSN